MDRIGVQNTRERRLPRPLEPVPASRILYKYSQPTDYVLDVDLIRTFSGVRATSLAGASMIQDEVTTGTVREPPP